MFTTTLPIRRSYQSTQEGCKQNISPQPDMCHCSFGYKSPPSTSLQTRSCTLHVSITAIDLNLYQHHSTTFHQTTYCFLWGQIEATSLSIRIAGDLKCFCFFPDRPQLSALCTKVISERKVAVQGCLSVTTIPLIQFFSRQPNRKTPRVSTPPKSTDSQFDQSTGLWQKN